MHPTRRAFLKLSAAATAVAVLPNTVGQSLLTLPPAPANAKTPPDRRLNSAYMQHSIKNISDSDLFAAMDLTRPDLADVAAAVARGDYPAAYAAWARHWPRVAARAQFVGDLGALGNGGLIGSRAQIAASLEPLRDDVLTRANRVLAHLIQGWGDVTIRHGAVVDFNADYGKSGKYGFHYWDWAQPLIHAFLLTNDPAYLAEFDALFNSWYEQRNRVKGGFADLDVIYYELGLGVRNRVFFEYYALPLANRGLITHERMLKTMLGAARWLYEEERLKYRSGNWQIMGSYGLAHLGLMLPEFTESARWVPLGAGLVLRHVEEDFFADGCHSERVPASYMIIAYRDPRNLARLLSADPARSDEAAAMRAPLERTLNWYLDMLPPDGILPAINDGPRMPMPAGILQDGVDFFGRLDMRWAQRALLGKTGVPAGGAPPALRSVHFPESGFTALRSDWTPAARFMLINHGPSGGGHSHADSLSFEMHAFGQAMALDAGIGETYDDPNHHSWYITSRAHNMLTIDESNLDRKAAEGKDAIWSTGANVDYFAATHHGYEASKGIIHRRHFAFVRSDYFFIYDAIESGPDASGKSAEWHLHAPVALAARELTPGDRTLAARGFDSPASPGLLVIPASDWSWELRKGLANVSGVRGYDISTTRHQEIPWLTFRRALAPGARESFGVLLYPYEARTPAVALRQSGRPLHFSIDHPQGRDHLLFGDESSGAIDFAGRFAFVRFRSRAPVQWSVAHATRLCIDGRVVHDSDKSCDGHGQLE
jgi:hypothetical protein